MTKEEDFMKMLFIGVAVLFLLVSPYLFRFVSPPSLVVGSTETEALALDNKPGCHAGSSRMDINSRWVCLRKPLTLMEKTEVRRALAKESTCLNQSSWLEVVKMPEAERVYARLSDGHIYYAVGAGKSFPEALESLRESINSRRKNPGCPVNPTP